MTFDEWVKKNKDKDKQATVDWGGARDRATPAKSASEAKSFDEWVTTNYGSQQQKDRYKATHAQPATQQQVQQPSYQQPAQTQQQTQQPTVNNAARVSEIQKQIAEREAELKKYGTYTGAAKGSDPIGSIWARLSPTNWMPALKGEPTRYENAKTESKRLQDEIYQLNLELAKAQYGDSGNVGDYLLKTLQAEGGKLESEIEYLDPGFLDRVFNHDKWEEESAREEELRAKWRENKQSQDQMQYANYLNLMQSADFAQSSQPTGSKIVQTIGERGGYRYSAFNEGDKRYDYINNIDGYRDGYFVNDMAGNENLTKYEFMNPDEIGVYNYLYNKEGAESADKFLTTLDDVLNYRYGLAQAKDANTGIEKILYAIPAGLDQFSTGFEQVFKDEALPTTATQYAAGTIRQGNKDEGIEGMGAVGGFTYDLLQSAANMAPSILLSSLATAMGAPAAAGQIIGAGTMGMSAAGNAYNEKLKQGYDKGSARTYATLVGASEATLQYALGGLSSMGGKYSISKVASNISAIDNAFGRVALKVGAAAFSEGAEEALQEILEPVIATLTLNEKYDPAEIEDVMYSFLLGAVSGGLLEGGTVIAEDIQTTRDGATLAGNSAEIINDIIQQGLESERGSTQYQVAAQLRTMLDNGQELSTYQLGRLYAEMGGVNVSGRVGQTETAQEETPVQTEPEPEQTEPVSNPEQFTEADPLEEAAREAAANEGMTLEDVAREVAERETAQDMPTEPAEQAQSEQQPVEVKLPEAEEKPVKTAQEASKETVAENATVEAPEIKAAYEAGKTGLPMDKVSFVSEEQREAFNAGRMDAIREMPENTDISTKPVETAAKQEYTDSKETGAGIAQQLQGSDRVIDGGIEYTINQDKSGMFFVDIKRADDVMGGYVSNARSKMYHGGPFNTREDAIAELAAVAENMVSNGITKKEPTSRKISEAEEGALLAYKSSESYKINDALRNGTELSEYQKSIVANLDSALEKLPAKKGTFYRNISFDYFGGEEAFNDFIEGAETGFMSFDGYTSTSTDQDGYPVEGEYVVHIVIEGQNGRDLEGFGANFESEVLFPRGMNVEVDRVEYGSDGKPTIYIREDVVSDGQSGAERAARRDSSREQNRQPEGDQVSRVQEVQQVDEENKDLQPVPEQNTRGDILGQEDLRGDEADTEVTPKNRYKESANDVHEGLLDREGKADNGGLQPEPVQEAEESRDAGAEAGQSGKNVAGKDGGHVQASEGAETSERSVNSGSDDNRVRESDNSDGDRGVGARGNDSVDEVKQKDFAITKAVAEEIDTKAPSLDDNINAIKVLHELEASGKAPTKAQQAILAKFKGWGGLANSFYGVNRQKLQEIMTPEEITAAQSTVNDAYFTPTNIIDAVYKALEHLGFEGGNILEPSMGVGNFFGRMPKAIKGASSLFGVEIDSISGRIAQHLYPSAKIEISPFQDVAYKDGAFDLIVGNVPFGEVKYKYKNNKYLIHDYFFVKAMDKLADGGVMVFLTSRGTLDKIDQRTRAELARQGNLIAAYRLPSSVFSKSASANVVTDLIIMQKSANPNGERFANLGSVDIMGDDFSVNEYFVNHPENIIGQLTKKWDYRSRSYVFDVKETGNTAEQLGKAIKKLPKGLLSGTQTVGSVSVTESTEAMNTFAVKDDGTVEYIDAQTGEVKQIKGKSAETAKEYIKLTAAYQSLIDATLADAGTEVVESRRKELNTLYDRFVKKYGTLEKNKKLLSADNDFVKVAGLEVYDTKTKSIIKSEMFTKDTLGKRKPQKADSALDALGITIGETGGVNIARIVELTGLSEEEAVKQLQDRIIYTPEGTYELNEVYLSGNVREKYEAVKGKKGFEKNEQMLKAVIPEDIPAKNIAPQFGSPWIAADYVADFLSETLHLHGKPTVSYDATTGTWAISGNAWGDHTLLTNKYGTKYIDAIKLAEKALNMRKIVVKNSEGAVLLGETRAAQQKAEDIKAAFEEWCFKDSKRRQELVTIFNEKFNSHRNMDFSELSKYLTFGGLTETFKLRDYQKRAVARAIFNGNTLLAHGVGTGKTAEMIAIAMELKRMGIAKKNMMVVPNHKVADFRNDILKMYPSAKVIMLEKGANAAQRQRFYAQVAANDFDIVIMPHSSFGMLDVSADTKAAFVSNQLAQLEEVMIQLQQEKGKNVDGRFIRQLENQKKRLEEKMKQITESAKDSGNTFEELGVDSLFVDEAHNFKNLPFYTKLSRVAGVSINQSNNKTRASRAENMFMITDYLNRNNGRITFGTATPITNSMSEIYNMIRFLRPDILEDAGIQSFDAWASMFGSIVNQAEVDPSGRKFRMKERFSKFKNVAQMVEQFRRMADILKTGDVIQELPKAERIDVISESNEIQEEFLDIVDKMIDEIRRSGQNAEHNMLEVTTAGQMAAVDLRFVESYFEGKYTREELNLPNNRIARVAENVVKEYMDSNDRKGTQFVFCDVGINDDPSKKYNLHVYGDLINRLVAGGIPRNEIAVAQDFEDKADLSAKVNTGEIRVLIGSTAVMGEGMNAQNKAVALHHMTVPYRPSDIEQREGRIIRYGNENKDVRIYRYIQEKSYDSYQWQMQERKAAFINQALSGGTVEELEEMSDFQLTAREAKAIASGNPLLLEKIEVEDKLNKLKSLRNKFNIDKREMQDRLAILPKRIAKIEQAVTDGEADIATINANGADGFEMLIGKTKLSERAEAAKALEKAISKAPRNGARVLIGSYKGLDLYYSSTIANGTKYILKGEKEYTIDGGESAVGNITRIINAVEKIPNLLAMDKAALKNLKSEIVTLEKEVNAEFPQTKELEELQTKLNDIDTQLGINVAEVDMSEVGVDEEDGDTDDVQYSRGVSSPDRWTAERVGDKDKAPKPLTEIIEGIRHDFGIQITTGHIRGKDTLGQYNQKNHGIRSKVANDLPTIAHEVGHHLDNMYGLTTDLPDALKKELENGLDDGLKAAYKEDLWVTEGYAEFFRKFLQNHETAAIDYPEFTKHFKSMLGGNDRLLIEQLANDVNAYYSRDADTATSSIRLREEKLPDSRTVFERVEDALNEKYQSFVNQNHGIKRFDDATGAHAELLASNAAYSDAMAAQIITGDLTDANGQYVAEGLKTALHGIKIYDKTEYKEFGEYLVVRHGPERLAEGKRVFADDRKDNTNYMQRRQAELEAKYPEFKAAAERLYTFQRRLLNTWGVQTGLVSRKSFVEWGKRWQFYVPFNRAVSEEKRGIGAKMGFANQTSTINKAIGSGLDIVHPVDNIINNIVKMVTAGTRNNVMREITNSAQKLGADATFLEKVPAPLVKKTFNLTETKEELMDNIDETDISESDKEKVFDIIIEMDDILEQYGRGKAKGDVVTVMKNGKPEFWKINDKGLLDSLTNLSTTKLEGFMGAYAAIGRLMTATQTGLNIVWSVFSNLPRDLVTLYTYSETKNPIKLFGAMGSAYINKVRYDTGKEADPLYREYLAMGGGQQSAFTADIDLAKKARKKLSDKKTFGDYANPLEWLVYTSNLIEMGPRFATYKLMRQKGLNSQEAFYAAMDITVNFRRGGKAARTINYFVPFFNVSVQGLDKFRRWITADEYRGKAERKQVVRNRTLAFFAVSAALAALQYALTHGDEEEEKYYEQLSVYQKNSYWNIPTGDGKYFALPKPRELAVLTSLMERALEAGLGENEHAFDEFYAYAAQNMLPKIASDLFQIPTNGLGESVGNAIGGTGILGVAVNMLANRDFLGRPIVSAGLQNLEKKDQYTNRTSKLAYAIGQATDSSPTQIDYFFGQVLGGFWKYQKALFPVGEGERDLTLGVRNTYVKDSQYSTDLVNWMYDKADKSSKAANSNSEDMEKAITAKMDANMTTFYSRYYKLAKDKKETVQARGARQAVLDMIYEYQKAADHGVLTDVQEDVYAVVEQQGKTELLPSVMQNTIKDADGKEHTLTDVDYVEFQTDYNRLYWEYVESNLSGAVSDLQKAAVLRSAKVVALEDARRRALGRIGANAGAAQYGSTDSTYAVAYKAARSVANEDGSVKQDEVINILDKLLADGLDSNSAYDIYLSEYSSSEKLITGAKQAGIDADTFLEYKYNLNNLEYEKGVSGARKEAYTEMLDSLGLTEEQYDYLFGTEYKTSSDDKDGGLFGGGFSGGFKSKW